MSLKLAKVMPCRSGISWYNSDAYAVEGRYERAKRVTVFAFLGYGFLHGGMEQCSIPPFASCIIYAYRVVMSVIEAFKHWQDRPTGLGIGRRGGEEEYERVEQAQGRDSPTLALDDEKFGTPTRNTELEPEQPPE